MSLHLRFILIFFSISLILIIMQLIRKDYLPIKYSLFWFSASLLIFLVGLVPDFIGMITSMMGFETTSNMVIGIILGIILFITLLLTIIISRQKKTIQLLIQEVSILKNKIDEEKGLKK